MRKLFILLLVLGACASKPQDVVTYRLPAAAGASGGPEAVYIAPAKMSDSLNTRGIVYQTAETVYHEAAGHKWAGQLGQMIQESTAARLEAGYPRYTYTTRRAGTGVTVNSVFTAFHGRYDGAALVAGQWFIEEGQSVRIVPFSFETALSGDGYPALVGALAEGLNRAADRLAQALAED